MTTTSVADPVDRYTTLYRDHADCPRVAGAPIDQAAVSSYDSLTGTALFVAEAWVFDRGLCLTLSLISVI